MCVAKNIAIWLRLVYFCCTHLQVEFAVHNVYFWPSVGEDMLQRQSAKKLHAPSEGSLKRVLADSGYSEETAYKIWKWYNPKTDLGPLKEANQL